MNFIKIGIYINIKFMIKFYFSIMKKSYGFINNVYNILDQYLLDFEMVSTRFVNYSKEFYKWV